MGTRDFTNEILFTFIGPFSWLARFIAFGLLLIVIFSMKTYIFSKNIEVDIDTLINVIEKGLAICDIATRE